MTIRLDAVYVTSSAKDGRFTRICVASIRHFYPDVPIRVLAGGPLESGLAEELARCWDAPMADLPRGDWGWGFVKLEPLFGPPGERFLVLDSDTAFAGPVLETWAGCEGDFLVDDEQQTEADTHRLYYDWRKIAAVDPAVGPPAFVFNSGQWFGTAGLVSRRDFERLVDWSGMPPRLRHAGLFMPGDQGVLNYVLNQKARLDGLKVDRRKLMRWPGHGMEGIDATTVAGRAGPPVIVHWAGMKKARLGAMAGADVLRFYEKLYYSRMTAGALRRLAVRARSPLDDWRGRIAARLRHALHRPHPPDA